MSTNLWIKNRSKYFWHCRHSIDDEIWEHAIHKALPILNLNQPPTDEDNLLKLVLGEEQFGANHWRLSNLRRFYYQLKPLIPRSITRLLRQLLQKRHKRDFQLGWPIEESFTRFQFEVLKNILTLTGRSSTHFKPLWPHKKNFSFVLTHDIEEDRGQKFVSTVADLEEGFGFRSSFNFVPEKYQVDIGLVNELRQRGFEIGIHGLKHDGKLFSSHTEFMHRAKKINQYLKKFDAVGFRAPLTHRHPDWMQALNIEYDLSFFDTDPYEPIPGGTMSIWPFFLGHFVEMPYTLVQDYTLTSVLGETTPAIWLEKVDFIEKYHGMALVNSHPDYLKEQTVWNIYREFLSTMKQRNGYWHALPKDTAKWWRNRESSPPCATVQIDNDQLVFGTAIDVQVQETTSESKVI